MCWRTAGRDHLPGPLSVLQPEGRGLGVRFFIVEPDRSQLVELARLVDEGTLHVEVAEAFPLEAFAEAYVFARTTRRRGKVIVDVAPTGTGNVALPEAATTG